MDEFGGRWRNVSLHHGSLVYLRLSFMRSSLRFLYLGLPPCIAMDVAKTYTTASLDYPGKQPSDIYDSYLRGNGGRTPDCAANAVIMYRCFIGCRTIRQSWSLRTWLVREGRGTQKYDCEIFGRRSSWTLVHRREGSRIS